jgi:CHRD domain
VTSKAASQSFKVTLTGAQQVPPVEIAATGIADLTYDPATRVLTWSVSYSGLSGAGHHGPFPRTGDGGQERSAVEAPIKGEATLTPEHARQFSAGEW